VKKNKNTPLNDLRKKGRAVRSLVFCQLIANEELEEMTCTTASLESSPSLINWSNVRPSPLVYLLAQYRSCFPVLNIYSTGQRFVIRSESG
jgi:hypothetical protein